MTTKTKIRALRKAAIAAALVAGFASVASAAEATKAPAKAASKPAAKAAHVEKHASKHAPKAAHAEKGLVVTLGGYEDLQFGFRDEKAAFDVDPNNLRLHKFAVVNDTKVRIKADGHAAGLKYGGMIVLNADTSNSKTGSSNVGRQTMVYAETMAGRLEAGSYTGAYDAMKVNGASVARATGGVDGDTQFWINQDNIKKFKFTPGLPTNEDSDNIANAAKITYYTPTYYGVQAGLTYVNDTEQHGAVGLTRSLAKNFTSLADSGISGFKNVLQGGLAYNGKFDKMGFRFAALGEVGDAKKAALGTRHDLRAYEVGAALSYANFGFAGSYGDNGKSGAYKFISAPVTGRKTSKYWTLGANYVHGKMGASVTYLSSKQGRLAFTGTVYSPTKAKASVLSFGLDYQLAPGFMPYAEFTMFNMKNGALAVNNPLRKEKGHLILAGTKLSF